MAGLSRKRRVKLVNSKEAQRKELLAGLKARQPDRYKEFEKVCEKFGIKIESLDYEFLKAGPSALEAHMKGLKLMQSRRRESAR